MDRDAQVRSSGHDRSREFLAKLEHRCADDEEAMGYIEAVRDLLGSGKSPKPGAVALKLGIPTSRAYQVRRRIEYKGKPLLDVLEHD